MFCSNCGTRISGDAAFCPNCGAPVERDINQVSFKAAADNQVNNKKPVIIGACCSVAVLAVCLLCVVLLTRTLSADHSDTSVTASGDSDSIEEESINVNDDNNGEEAAANDDTIVVSDEAYIERLEAYQEYYNSVKDEANEVVAAISLNEDNLPILWIGYADDLFMRKDDDGIQNDDIREFHGYYEVYDYQNGEVTLLAGSTSCSLSGSILIYLKSDELTIRDADGRYMYDKDSEEFVDHYFSDVAASYDGNWSWYIENEDAGVLLYFGHKELNNANVTWFEATRSDYAYFWWDDSEVSYEEWHKVAAYGRSTMDYGFFLDAASFDVLIEDLKSSPIYDINLLAVEYDTFYSYWEDGVRYSVEYLGYDKLNEYLAE